MTIVIPRNSDESVLIKYDDGYEKESPFTGQTEIFEEVRRAISARQQDRLEKEKLLQGNV